MKATAVQHNYHPAATAFLKFAVFVFLFRLHQRGVDPTLWSFLRLCFVLKVCTRLRYNVKCVKKKKKMLPFP